MTTPTHRQLISGTAVSIDGLGVLLIGPSGSGKSDLAIRLIAMGALLVSDDVVEIGLDAGEVHLSFPAGGPRNLQGRIEARGVGIVSVPAATAPVPLALVVRLVSPEKVNRILELETETYLGQKVRVVELAPFEASTAPKVRLALHHRGGDIIPAP